MVSNEFNGIFVGIIKNEKNPDQIVVTVTGCSVCKNFLLKLLKGKKTGTTLQKVVKITCQKTQPHLIK